jgi:peptide deformylase
MILKIEEMPKNLAKEKIVLIGKIDKKSSFLDYFPVTEDHFNKMKSENALPKLTKELKNIFWRLVKASIENQGIGVAAPQIGINKRIFTIKNSDTTFKIFIHPSFTKDLLSNTETEVEGCLSIPSNTFKVPRDTIINACWFEFDQNEKLVFIKETLDGFAARVFAHEENHLDAVSIIDLTNEIGRQKKRELLKKLK